MLRRAGTLGLCLAMAGCSLLGPRTKGPDGLSVYDGDLRRLVRQARFDDALELAESDGDAAGDDLLATLNLATVEHYAGRFETSSARLIGADVEIDKRFTKSVTRAALSLITNDRVLAWLPSRIERPMIHVYGALNYLALGELDEAAVEARRLSLLLDEMSEHEPEGDEYDVYRTLRYFAGAVFEGAGELNDADVAYRYAGFEDETSWQESRSDLGEVVLLVESGFVANRVEQSVNLILDADDADFLHAGSDRARHHAASCLSRERLGFAYESFGASLISDGASLISDDCRRPPRRPRPRHRKHDDDHDGDGHNGNDHDGDDHDDHDGDDGDVAYLLRVAWPVMRRSIDAVPVSRMRAFAPSSQTLVAVLGDGTATMSAASSVGSIGSSIPASIPALIPASKSEALLSADLSGAVISDFNGRAPGILIKAVARAAVKYKVVHDLADDSEVKQVVGNAVMALLERADTRSWTLLPSDLHILRLQLPAGTHQLLVEFDVDGFAAVPLVLDGVIVEADRVAVISARAWP